MASRLRKATRRYNRNKQSDNGYRGARPGYVRFDIPKGTEVKVGGVLCYVTDNPTDPLPQNFCQQLRPIRGFTSDRPKSQRSLLPRASAVRPLHF